MEFADFFGLCMACSLVVLVLAAWIDDVARRAERIYIARHRDHSKVPPIRGRDAS